MARDYRPYTPEQPYLLPPAPQDWLTPDHLAYSVRDVVAELDLAAIEAGYSRDGRGAPAYHPRLMVSLLLYAWCNHVFSSRRIARLAVDDLGGRFLAAGHQPDFRSISDFRLRHGEALRGLFLQSLRLCQAAGMVTLGQVSLDGTKIAAAASKHKAMSYGRMVEDEARLQQEVDELLRRSAETDAAEDEQFGKDNPGSWLPEELHRREERLRRLREAKAALEAEAKAAAEEKRARHEAKQRGRAAHGEPRLGGKPPADPETVTPKEKAQRNFTDPESRIMKAGDGSWVQGYNAQAAVDGENQVIVACELSDCAADAGHLARQMEQVIANTGFLPDTALADPGYFSASNVDYLEWRGIPPLIPPDRQRHGTPAAPVEQRPEAELAALSPADRQRHLVSTAAGRAAYAKRKVTVEPVFGQIKGCPGTEGFRAFLRRGKRKCQQEWAWVCAAHNFKKYFRFQQTTRAARRAREQALTA
jgi:transposase